MDQFKTVFKEIVDKHGLTLNFACASKLLCYPTSGAARAAVRRGSFPVPVRRAGKRMLVSAADVAGFLVGVLIPSPSPTQVMGAAVGRPSKAMVLQARRLGFSNVAEMRQAHRRNCIRAPHVMEEDQDQ
jgi:hypothetical protein